VSQYDVNRETASVARDEARRETSNNAVGWLVAGVVAIVAIIAVAFMVMSGNPAPTAQDLQTAADNARAQGIVEGANSTLSSVQSGAQSAADQTAADTRAAAASARDAADRAASSARDATTAATPPPAEIAPNEQAPQ
jgi:hypothetical protein